MKNNAAKILLVFLVAAAFLFAIGSFITLSLNPKSWGTLGRLFYVAGTIVITMGAAEIILRKS